MIVWMSTLRRGLSFHFERPDEPKTVCGRFMGRPGDERGHRLPRMRALDLGARPCEACVQDGTAGTRPMVRRGDD